MKCKSNSMNVARLIWTGIEIGLFCGISYGWSSWIYVFKDNGIFADICLDHNVELIDNATYNGATPSTDTFTNATTTYYDDVPTGVNASNFEKNAAIECRGRNDMLSLVFTTTSVLTGILSIINGYIYDRFGTLVCRLLSLSMYASALIAIAFSKQSAWANYLLFPAFFFLRYGGLFLFVTSLQTSALFPRSRSTILAAYNGLYDASASVAIVFKLQYENGIPLSSSLYVFLSVFLPITLLGTFIFQPWKHIHSDNNGRHPMAFIIFQRLKVAKYIATNIENDERMRRKYSIAVRHVSMDITPSKQSRGELQGYTNEVFESPNKTNLSGHGNIQTDSKTDEIKTISGCRPKDFAHKDSTASSQETTKDCSSLQNKDTLKNNTSDIETDRLTKILFSPLFLWNIWTFSFLNLRNQYFFVSFNSWITDLSAGDRKLVTLHTSVFTGMLAFGFLVSPLAGIFIDTWRKREDRGSPHTKHLRPYIYIFTTEFALNAVFNVSSMIPSLNAQYFTYIAFVTSRGFLYAVNAAFISEAFPQKHFGKLLSATFASGTFASALQQPIFIGAESFDNGFLIMNGVLLALNLTLFGFPIYITRQLKTQKDPPNNVSSNS
ncbi:unnamed protein product [Owenia fusiformis]|uniref:Solute carrier family 43 member 3 n=1 Tax=Owenia fusiformis TaxID=6347 RepID=A0A8S4MUF0_OWEFU|nr:unnamed protein product [Owenia fusiformis]